MPAFALLSGYLSKPNAWTKHGLARSIQLAAVYAMACVVAIIIQLAFHQPVTHVWLGTIPLGMWWLVSLFCWRNALPVFDWIGRKAGWWIAAAAAVAVLIAVFLWVPDGLRFSLMRTVYFGLFFFAGYLVRIKGRDLRRLARWWPVAAGLFAVAAVAMVANVRYGWIKSLDTLLYGRSTLQALGWHVEWKSLVLFGGVCVASLVLSVAFFACVPRGPSWLALIGQRSLGIYVCHLLVLGALQFAHVFFTGALVSSFACLGVVLALVAVLTWGPLARGVARVIDWTKPAW